MSTNLAKSLHDPRTAKGYLAAYKGDSATWPEGYDPRHDLHGSAVKAKAETFAQMDSLMKTAEREGRDFKASESRTYAALEANLNTLDELAQLSTVDRTGVVDPRTVMDSSSKYQQDRPLMKGQTFVGACRAQGLLDVRDRGVSYEDDGPAPSLGKIVKAMAIGDWAGAEYEQSKVMNAMSGAGAGGVLLPTVTSAGLIDLARNKTRILEAGAQIVPMSARTIVVPRWTGDPSMAWRAENAAVGEVDGTMDSITLVAKTMAAIVRISRELIEDTEVEAVVADAVASAIAVKWDYAGLYGAGTNEPTGVKQTATVTKTSLGTNGATPTWDNLIDAVGRLRDNNEEPSAQILADRTSRTLAKVKEATTNAYLKPPTYLDGVPRLTTNQVPVNLTVGTSTDTSDLFTGDFSQLILGVRTGPLTIQLSERYSDSGQIGLLCWFRGDIAVARSKAFDVVTGIRP